MAWILVGPRRLANRYFRFASQGKTSLLQSAKRGLCRLTSCSTRGNHKKRLGWKEDSGVGSSRQAGEDGQGTIRTDRFKSSHLPNFWGNTGQNGPPGKLLNGDDSNTLEVGGRYGERPSEEIRSKRMKEKASSYPRRKSLCPVAL